MAAHRQEPYSTFRVFVCVATSTMTVTTVHTSFTCLFHGFWALPDLHYTRFTFFWQALHKPPKRLKLALGRTKERGMGLNLIVLFRAFLPGFFFPSYSFLFLSDFLGLLFLFPFRFSRFAFSISFSIFSLCFFYFLFDFLALPLSILFAITLALSLSIPFAITFFCLR